MPSARTVAISKLSEAELKVWMMKIGVEKGVSHRNVGCVFVVWYCKVVSDLL